ncbi:MAG: thiamine pyrophosphate-binding protein [Candidatus Curtissbacteria bacterium]|nr:thiamine pyrophosphate-binding protein [Candidatus Curtissbacteria bacterium]
MKHSPKKIRVADYVVQFLVKNRMRDIFLLTGYGAMYLNDAIAKEKKINYYCVRNEAASPMMAEAYARLKQSPGVVCLTAGPGATNAIPGLAEAWVDAAPVLVISGQVELRHTTHKVNLKSLRSFGTAEINIIPVVKPMTKYAQIITNPTSIRYHLEKALYLATSGRPGPVWLDIPHDVQSALVDPLSLKGFKVPKNNLNRNLQRDVSRVLTMFGKSKRPLIVAGHGIRQGKAIGSFKKLVDSCGAPVAFSRLGIDILPYSDEHNMGLAGIRGNRFSNQVMKQADFVFVLGSRLAIPFVGPNLDCFDRRAKIAVVDIEGDELKKPGVKIDISLNYDVKDFIEHLYLKLPRKISVERRAWLKSCQELKAKYPAVDKSMKRNPIDLYYFMYKLDQMANKNHVMVTDSGSNYYIGGQVWQFNSGQREITSGTFGAMGLSIPLAIGASVEDKNSQILAVTGDGSLELNIQELKTISYYGLNVKVFVINNGGYVSMRRWQDTFFEGRRIGSDDKTGIAVLNLRRVAEAFDLNYEIIDRWQDISEKLKKIMADDNPIFVEVVCDSKQKLIEPISPNDMQI